MACAIRCVCFRPCVEGDAAPFPVPVSLFANTLDLLAVEFPDAVVTSWVRSASENQAAGGAAGSLHLEGLAADVDLPLADRSRLIALGRAAESLGLAAIVYDTGRKNYVHVQARPLLDGATFKQVFV